MPRRATCLAVLVLAAGCSRGPSREEALAALRAAHPSLDTTTAFARVWRDGPPWFSCAEVRAKLGGPADSAAVRDQVGNWGPLMRAGWAVLHDTAAGPVRDPGWCMLRVVDTTRIVRGWRAHEGDSLPSGGARRGWIVEVGRQRVVVADEPRREGRDSALVRWAVTVAPNANGVALGAQDDSLAVLTSVLRRDGERWRVEDGARGP